MGCAEVLVLRSRPQDRFALRRAKQLRANEMAAAGVKSLSQPQSAAAGVMQRISNRRDVAQPGRALAWGARGRQFKSARPDQSIAVLGFVKQQGHQFFVGVRFAHLQRFRLSAVDLKTQL
jgi:hypothetical protein